MQGSNYNLTILDFLVAGLARGLQGSNCNLTILDCLVAGPEESWRIATALCVLEVFVLEFC